MRKSPKVPKPDGEGFEPTVRFRTPVFKTGPLNHSGIHPRTIAAMIAAYAENITLPPKTRPTPTDAFVSFLSPEWYPPTLYRV